MNYGRIHPGKWMVHAESRYWKLATDKTTESPPPMPSHKSLVTSHESPVKGPNSFRFTHFRKNASASPLDSHTFKTKDLKPFRFTHFQKKGGGRVPFSNIRHLTSNLRSSLSPLDSALTSKRAAKSFTCNTYEKHTQGEGAFLGSEHESQVTNHKSPVTSHQSPVT